MSDLVGDAYVRLHLRGNERAMHRAVKRMGERAGEDFSAEFDKMVAKTSGARLQRSMQRMADAVTDVDFSGMRREGERLQDMQRRLNSVFDNWVKTQVASREETVKYKEALGDWVTMERTREKTLRDSIQALGESTKGLHDIAQLEDALAKARKKHSDAAKRAYADDLDLREAERKRLEAEAKEEQKRYDRQEARYRRFADQMKAIDRSLIDSFAKVMSGSHAKRWDDMILKGENLDEAYTRLSRTVRRLSDEQEINSDTTRSVTRSMDDWYRSMRGAQNTAKEFHEILGNKKRWDDMRRNSESVEDAYRRLSGRIQEAGRASRITSSDQGRLTASLQGWRIELDKGDDAWHRFTRRLRRGIGDQAPRFERIERSLGRTRRHITLMPDLMGKIGGRGARNDFINLIGVFTRGIGSMLTLLPRLTVAAGESLGALGKNLSEAARSGQSLASVLLNALAGALINLPLMLAGVVLALGAMAVALPAVVSLLSLLAGALVVVASALSFGLIGSLLVLGPLLAGVGGAIMLLVGTIDAWKDATDAQLKHLAPLKDAWEDFKQSLQESFLPELMKQLGQLGHLVETFVTPLLLGIGDAILAMIGHFNTVTRSPEVRGFFSMWEEKLPKIMESFGVGLADMLVGLLAFFAPILDYTQRMATSFQDAMETFRKWALSAEGQNAIAEYMERAYKAATDLWGVIKATGTLLRELFNVAWESGGADTFLENLETRIRSITDWIRNNKDVVAGWFEDVQNFMSGLGDFLTSIFGSGGLWDQLDNADMRGLIGDFLSGFEAIDWTGLGDSVNEVVEAFVNLATSVPWADIVNGIADTLNDMIGMFEDFVYEADRLLTLIGKGDVITGSPFDIEQQLKAELKKAAVAAGEGGVVLGAKLGEGWSSGIERAPLDIGIGDALAQLEGTFVPVAAKIGAGLGASMGSAFSVDFEDTMSGSASRFGDVGRNSMSDFVASVTNGLTEAKASAVAEVSEMTKTIESLMAQLPASMQDAGAGIGSAVGAGLGGVGAIIEDSLRDVPSKLTGPFGMASSGVSFEMLTLASNLRSGLQEIAPLVADSLAGVPASVTSVMQQMRQAAALEASGTGADISASLGTVPAQVSAALQPTAAVAQVAMAATRVAAMMEASLMAPQVGAEASKVAPSVSTALSTVAAVVRVQMTAASLAARLEAMKMNNDVRAEASKIPGSLNTALSASAAMVRVQMVAARLAATVAMIAMNASIRSEASKVPGALSSALAPAAGVVRSRLSAAVSAARSGASAIVGAIRSGAAGAAGALSAALSGLAGAVAGQMSRAVAVARSMAASIRAAISAASGTIRINAVSSRRAMATGGVVHSATNALIGEAGPEAVVPLTRPLSQIDPSVRWMAEMIRGQRGPGGGAGVRIEPGAIVVQTPLANPHHVAEATIDRVVARFAN